MRGGGGAGLGPPPQPATGGRGSGGTPQSAALQPCLLSLPQCEAAVDTALLAAHTNTSNQSHEGTPPCFALVCTESSLVFHASVTTPA